MRSFCFTMVMACCIWAGASEWQMNSASAQAATFTGVVPATNQFSIPLTNQIGFTNTVVESTNLSSLQLNDLLTLLLRLQTNVEQTLPALTLVTSNVTVVNASTAGNVTGGVMPITSNPPGLVLSPTGAATGTPAPAPQTSFTVRVGTNTFGIDAATLQGVVTLRDDLERALPVLQALNGTSPSPPVASAPARSFNNPTFPTLIPGFTQPVTTPLTNQPVLLTPGVPSAF